MKLPGQLGTCLALLVLSTAGCGEDSIGPDVAVEDLVGTWNASAMVLTDVGDPSRQVDVLDLGASFFLDVQPSGGYTSSLSLGGASLEELGQLEVDEDRLIFHVQHAATGPRTDTARFQLDGNTLTLEGRTVFDFDQNGIGETARLDAALIR